MLRPLSRHVDERPAPIVLVLPTPDVRAPIRTALSLARGRRTRLRALSLTRPGEGLPAELRIALFGLGVRNEADRAIAHLVQSAVRGSHVAVKPVAELEQERLREAHELGELPSDAPLIVAWSRGGPLPRADRLEPLLRAFGGPIVLLVDSDGPLPVEVLGLMPHVDAPGYGPVRTLLDDLERTLPVFEVPEANAGAAVGDSNHRTLVLGSLPPKSELESAVPGRLALVLPPAEGRADQALALIERVREARRSRAASEAGTPPPPPAP